VNRISPFARGMAVIALIAFAVVVLNLQTSLSTAATLVRLAFYLAIGLAAYMLWRDFGRREIGLWPQHAQRVFYGAVGLLLVDGGWYFSTALGGRDLLAFLIVAAVCIYAAVKTWREQHRYS
jgi:ABC-type nickel/cobalt efflux system permease component RcnA